MPKKQADSESKGQEPATAPDDTEPTAERLAELRRIYSDNVRVDKPPYAGASIESRGELLWIIDERS